MPNRRKREGDMGPLGPDIIVEEPTLLESEWLKEDLGSLIGSGVDSQLNAILGPEEAELFLHPTIKDKPRHATSSSNHVLKDLKKSGHLDAHVLWNSLRMQSKNKLMKEELKISHDAIVLQDKKLPESRLLRKIQYSRHCVELMHKVSQINRQRTKEILSSLYSLSAEGDSLIIAGDNMESSYEENGLREPGTCERIDIHVDENNRKDIDDPLAITLEDVQNKSLPNQDRKPGIHFLTEKECRCPGKFRQRMKELGVDVRPGISFVDNNLESQSSNKSRSCFDLRRIQSSEQLKQSKSWQPLTFSALTECKKPIVISLK